MNVYLGNLAISEIEERVGFEFPKEIKKFMEKTHQNKAENIQKGKWHCFDIPFTLVCGDIETAKFIYNNLKDYNFKEKLQISINKKNK